MYIYIYLFVAFKFKLRSCIAENEGKEDNRELLSDMHVYSLGFRERSEQATRFVSGRTGIHLSIPYRQPVRFLG